MRKGPQEHQTLKESTFFFIFYAWYFSLRNFYALHATVVSHNFLTQAVTFPAEVGELISGRICISSFFSQETDKQQSYAQTDTYANK